MFTSKSKIVNSEKGKHLQQCGEPLTFQMADSTGNSIVRGISATMNGSKQNIHEMNSDVNGLILPILIRTNGGMILLNITEEDSIIGKKHTDSISDTIKQNNGSEK